jgi:hypothetical protein
VVSGPASLVRSKSYHLRITVETQHDPMVGGVFGLWEMSLMPVKGCLLPDGTERTESRF